MTQKSETAGFQTMLNVGVLVIGLGVAVAAASAQTSGATSPVAPNRQGETPLPVPPSGPTTPPSSEGSSAPSNDLSRSGGVIQPPAAADPGMARPAPNPGAQSMPVIPPPGSPGSSDPSVIPK